MKRKRSNGNGSDAYFRCLLLCCSVPLIKFYFCFVHQYWITVRAGEIRFYETIIISNACSFWAFVVRLAHRSICLCSVQTDANGKHKYTMHIVLACTHTHARRRRFRLRCCCRLPLMDRNLFLHYIFFGPKEKAKY